MWPAAAIIGGCRATSVPPVPVTADAPLTAICFEPALPQPGTLTIAHESSFTCEVVARPSGCDVRIPEGPANLTLVVGGNRYELTTKISPAGGDLVWRWER